MVMLTDPPWPAGKAMKEAAMVWLVVMLLKV
jgi:hypothetical protein